MYRVDSHNAVPEPPAPETAEVQTPGYFSPGNAEEGINGTVVPAWWLNSVQENLLYVLERGERPFSKVDYDGLYQAVLTIVGNHEKIVSMENLLDGAVDDAATALTTANEAQTTAASGVTKADAAQARADAAYTLANNGSSQANAAYSLAENALGQWLTITDDFDADTYYANAARFYVTGDAENLPIETPCFFTNGYDSGRNVVIQFCFARLGYPTYARAGTVTIEDDEWTVDWTEWTFVAPTKDELTEYVNEQIAEHISGTLKYKGKITGFYDDAPAGVGTEGDVKLKTDGTKKAVYTNGAWVETDYEHALFDLWANVTDNHGYYWFNDEWNILDFDVDLSSYLQDADVVTSFSSIPSDTKVPSEKLVKDSIPDVSGKEDKVNKTTFLATTANNASDTKYPTEKAVVTAIVGLTGEIPDISGKEDKSNKTTSITAAASASDTKYPTEKAVATALAALDVYLLSVDFKAGVTEVALVWPEGYPYAQITYVGSDGTAAALSCAAIYATGSTYAITTTKTNFAALAGGAVSFTVNVTSGTMANFLVKLSKA